MGNRFYLEIKMHRLQQELSYDAKFEQRQLLSLSQQQALVVLQMSTLELSDWLKGEIDTNPCLEYDHSSATSSFSFQTNSQQPNYDREYPSPPSLFNFLMDQARLFFTDTRQIEIAEFIIGNLDAKGFLTDVDLPSYMEDTLKQLHLFDPPGIAARNLQESLLIQLRLKKKKDSLAFQILEHHFEDLLHNRYPQISKRLKCTVSEIEKAIDHDIAHLNLRPASGFFHEPAAAIIPDLFLSKEEESWSIEFNEDLLPEFFIKTEKKKDHGYFQRAKWLKKAIESRKKTLYLICQYLIQKHDLFLCGESDLLEPMTMQEIAEVLDVHTSTIARAVGKKHIFCPRGLIAMRSLFCFDLGNAMSNQSAKQLLLNVIAKEDKEHPLSDEALSLKMSALGIPLARRTITKYRKLHRIPSAGQRRKWLVNY